MGDAIGFGVRQRAHYFCDQHLVDPYRLSCARTKPELAWALSLINIAFGIPIVFFAPISGAWADRHDRKTTMILCDVGNGVAVSILLALIFTHQFNVPMLIVLVFVQAMITSFHNA
ncbi:MAG: MFS transporter, partial [Chloroflexi bacterium]|nr:MFS transporter [Chloroflexota bacterium]